MCIAHGPQPAWIRACPAKAERAVAGDYEQGLVGESRAIIAASLTAGKAATAHSPRQRADTAATVGASLEDLMRQAEGLHAQLLGLTQPVSFALLPGLPLPGPCVS